MFWLFHFCDEPGKPRWLLKALSSWPTCVIPRWGSRLLDLARPSPSCYGHLFTCLPLSLSVRVTSCNKAVVWDYVSKNLMGAKASTPIYLTWMSAESFRYSSCELFHSIDHNMVHNFHKSKRKTDATVSFINYFGSDRWLYLQKSSYGSTGDMGK